MINSLIENFLKVRKNFKTICEPLEVEDYQVQTIFDVSPPKWHLAHTTWFFEEFVLEKFYPNYKRFHPKYAFQFNSYYNHIGDRIEKDIRGIISRPTIKEIYQYRSYVEEKIMELAKYIDDSNIYDFSKLMEIGINHEQQHQELCLYDIKHIYYINPLKPIYRNVKPVLNESIDLLFIDVSAGLVNSGYGQNTAVQMRLGHCPANPGNEFGISTITTVLQKRMRLVTRQIDHRGAVAVDTQFEQFLRNQPIT